MSTVKSYAVGNGDMFYIRHNTDNFTLIDCDLCDDNASEILTDIKAAKSGKGLSRFICTHPDEGLPDLGDSKYVGSLTVETELNSDSRALAAATLVR